MAIMGKKVWAVVCGAIRQEFELYIILSMLCDYRAEGLLDGIVISTWKGEIDNFPDLRAKLKTLNIDAVELNQLDERLGNFMHINYARQAFQLKSGLDFIPDDVFVLKCRTDLCLDGLSDIAEILSGKTDMTLGCHGALQFGLEYRIAVLRYSASQLFALSDRTFLAYKQDMYKMISFESTGTRWNVYIWADMAFFLWPFVGSFPILSDVYTNFDVSMSFSIINNINKIQSCIANYLSQISSEQKLDFELPSVINSLYALYFVVLYNCFFLFKRYKVNKQIPQFDFTEIFTGNYSIGLIRDGIVSFSNMEALRMIVEGECLPTKGYMKLYKEICKFAVNGYAKKRHITKKEYDELSLFVKDVMKLDPKKALVPKQSAIIIKSDIGFNKALDILFDKYISQISTTEKLSFYDSIGNIAYFNSANANLAVAENIEKISKINSDLSEIILSSALRSRTPRLLKTAAKALLYNRLNMSNQIYEDGMCYIFDRWIAASEKYIMPLNSYTISAYYYYGKYAEPKEKNRIPKDFYNSLIRQFKLSPPTEPQSYADAVLDLIKEIVSAHFDERMSDPSIHNMVDFLIDDFGKDAFTAEQWEALAEYALNRKYSLPFKTADDDAFECLLTGAENAESELEAKIVSKLLLREKWNFPDFAQSADDALDKLAEKYPCVVSCFVKANFIDENEILTFNPEELSENDDFVLFVRILTERRLLSHFKTVLLNMYGEDIFRRMILELFAQLEKNEAVRFFSMKNGRDAWINYNKFSNSKINSELVLSRNADWWSWPFADSASPSSFAAFIKAEPDKIIISIELNSCPCSAKAKLLNALDKTKVNAFNMDDRIIRLRTATYQLESADKVGEAVENALNNFCEVGELLLNGAGEAKEGEKT